MNQIVTLIEQLTKKQLIHIYVYSGGSNWEHLNTEQIWIPIFLNSIFEWFGLWMVRVDLHRGYHLVFLPFTNWNKMFCFRMAFKNRTIQDLNNFWPSEIQTCWVLESPLYLHLLSINRNSFNASRTLSNWRTMGCS